MAYPSISDYEIAMLNFKKSVLAPKFTGGQPAYTNISGQPSSSLISWSGGFSAVYPITVGSKKIAFRCWLKNPGNINERYKRAKAYLLQHNLPYFADFGFIEEGILVNGTPYSISYIDWIEGLTLNEYLDQYIHDSSRMKTLAGDFLQMVKNLHLHQISHGDLQDGNIMIRNPSNFPEIVLIDYDSLFTPTMTGFIDKCETIGIPEFQHPMRTNTCNAQMDYFSELVIYLSLFAYAQHPNLWKKGQEKKLLFDARDYINPQGSQIFTILKNLPPPVNHLTRFLEDYCLEKNLDRLVPLESLEASINKNTPTSSTISELDIFFNTSRSTRPSHSTNQGIPLKKGVTPELEDFFSGKCNSDSVTGNNTNSSKKISINTFFDSSPIDVDNVDSKSRISTTAIVVTILLIAITISCILSTFR